MVGRGELVGVAVLVAIGLILLILVPPRKDASI
jgi:hypothetical protein